MRVRMTHRDSGSVMFAVLLFAGAISIIGFAASTLVVSGNKNVHQIAALKQAHYMAEMGIEEAISNPFILQKAFSSGTYTVHSPTPVGLEKNNWGAYEITVSKKAGHVVEFTSRGYVKNADNKLLATKLITCQFTIKPGSFYEILLENAIATSQNLNSGKVYIAIDNDENGNQVAPSANVYSDADITNIAGTVPGSVIARGKVIVNNNTTIAGDVIAENNITINNNTRVHGKVISAQGWIDVNNNVIVNNDIVAYGVDEKGYSVYLANSTVGNIYTTLGSSQVKLGSGSYGSIRTIAGSEYPITYTVASQKLPVIDETTKTMWKTQAQSDNIIYTNGLDVANNQTLNIGGNAYVNGNLTLNNNAKLRVKEGSTIYVTGYLSVENNAVIEVVDADNNQVTQGVSLITESYFDIKNNAVPDSVSLVALGSSTSYLRNNSVTTGTILVPNGNLEISNNATIYGGIFAKSIPKIGNNATVYFNPQKNMNLPPTVPNHVALDFLGWVE